MYGISSDTRDLITFIKNNVKQIINEIENETKIEIIKIKIHTLQGFFSNKEIVKLLNEILCEKNYKKIKILFEQVKNLILQEINNLII